MLLIVALSLQLFAHNTFILLGIAGDSGGDSRILNEFVLEPLTLLACALACTKDYDTYGYVQCVAHFAVNRAAGYDGRSVCAKTEMQFKCDVCVCVCHFRRIGHAFDTSKRV